VIASTIAAAFGCQSVIRSCGGPFDERLGDGGRHGQVGLLLQLEHLLGRLKHDIAAASTRSIAALSHSAAVATAPISESSVSA
jgi:hypothetical protein